jgi:hypothetical protein
MYVSAASESRDLRRATGGPEYYAKLISDDLESFDTTMSTYPARASVTIIRAYY